MHVVPVRKPLLALCDLEDHGHDIFFVVGKRWAKRRMSGEVIPTQRRGGKYEIDAIVVLGGACLSGSPVEETPLATSSGRAAAASSSQEAPARGPHTRTRGGGVNPLRVPSMPTQDERDRHEIDHCPYQSWCRSCVGGRDKADSHFARERESDDLKIDCVACD